MNNNTPIFDYSIHDLTYQSPVSLIDINNITPLGRIQETSKGISFDFCNSGIGFYTLTQTQLLLQLKGNNLTNFCYNEESIKVRTTSSCMVVIKIEAQTTFKIEKLTEALYSVMTICGIISGEIKPINSLQQPHIEFIGDSLTCGYGNIGDSEYESDSSKTWCVLIKNYLKGSAHYSSFSGIGLIRNYDLSTKNLITAIRKRSLALNPKTQFDIASWKAKYVFINIGTNDFMKPTTPEFIQQFKIALTKLIDDCYNEYGNDLWLFLVCGPLIEKVGQDATKECHQKAKINHQNVHYLECYIDQCRENWGYNQHPNVKGHNQMAKLLIQQLEKIIKSENY
ncbi:Endoglucanase [Entamoeba marina]